MEWGGRSENGECQQKNNEGIASKILASIYEMMWKSYKMFKLYAYFAWSKHTADWPKFPKNPTVLPVNHKCVCVCIRIKSIRSKSSSSLSAAAPTNGNTHTLISVCVVEIIVPMRWSLSIDWASYRLNTHFVFLRPNLGFAIALEPWCPKRQFWQQSFHRIIFFHSREEMYSEFWQFKIVVENFT